MTLQAKLPMLRSNEDRPLRRDKPVRMLMPRLRYPTVCGKDDCAHPQCNSARHQAALPCAECGVAIQPGEYLYVLKRDGVVVKEQVHASCLDNLEARP